MAKLFRRVLFPVGCLLCIAVSAMGQQVPTDPTSTHIFPAGGQRGTVVNVRVGGECLPPLTRFRLEGRGVKAGDVLGSRSPLRCEPAPRRKPGEQPIFYPKEWDAKI